MQNEVNELLLALNIKAEPHETAYAFQTLYAYKPEYKKMLPRQQFIKFYKNRIINKIYINKTVEAINYLNNELKSYSNKK